MSHAEKILAIFEREQRKKEIRAVKYGPLHDAVHEALKRNAALMEVSEELVSESSNKASRQTIPGSSGSLHRSGDSANPSHSS